MAPGQGSKPRYCLNPTGNKEGAGKAAHGCLKYVPIQTFLSYQLGFVSESEKPLKTRGSKRSVEDPYWCCSPFPRETSTRTHSHTVSHTGRRMADSEKLLLSFLLPLSGSQEVFKDNTAFIAQVPWSCSFPGGGTRGLGDREQFLHTQTGRTGSRLSTLVGKQQLGLRLLPDTSLARRTGKNG